MQCTANFKGSDVIEGLTVQQSVYHVRVLSGSRSRWIQSLSLDMRQKYSMNKCTHSHFGGNQTSCGATLLSGNTRLLGLVLLAVAHHQSGAFLQGLNTQTSLMWLGLGHAMLSVPNKTFKEAEPSNVPLNIHFKSVPFSYRTAAVYVQNSSL